MNIRLSTLCLAGLVAMTSFVARPARADEWNKRTEFEFSVPVQIPGQTLAAGKYVFQLADSASDRNIVRIFSEDASGHQSLVTTLLAVPDYTATTPDAPLVHFEERPSDSPEAIHSWFYPGRKDGWQFVYSTARSKRAG